MVKKPVCKDIVYEETATVEKPVHKDAASLGTEVVTVKQPPGEVNSASKDKTSVDKTAPVMDNAAQEGTGVVMGVSAVRQPSCMDTAVSADTAPIEKAADVVEKPATVCAASGSKDVATNSSDSGLVTVAVPGVKSSDAGVRSSDDGTVHQTHRELP